MSEQVCNNILTAFYLALWIATFVWYHYRYRYADGGSAIMTTYIIYIVFTFFTLNNEMFNFMYKPLTVFPYIYLYLMLLTALSPTIFHHFHPVSCLEQSPTRLLKPYAVIIILLALTQVPEVLANLEDGLVKMVTDTDAGLDTYNESLGDADDSGSGITNFFAIVYNACFDLTIFMAFYMLTLKKKNLFLIAGIFFSIAIGLLMPIMKGLRGPTVTSALTLLVAYMVFLPYINRKLTKIINIVGLIFVLAFSVPISTITLSRFGENNEGVFGVLTWYVGQANVYFNNHALDAGGIRYGDRTLNLFKRAIFSDTPKNFAERRAKYHNLEIDDERFTTFVGDFCIDFGPIVAALIFVVFNLLVLYQIRARSDILKLHDILLIYFTQCICIQGGMTLFTYSDTGNLKIIVMGLVYAYLYIHDELLKHFPLKLETDSLKS